MQRSTLAESPAHEMVQEQVAGIIFIILLETPRDLQDTFFFFFLLLLYCVHEDARLFPLK